MTTFDQVLPELLRLCEEDAESRRQIGRYCVVRDVRGRVRLVVEPTPTVTPPLDALTSKLAQNLGKYFVPPIISSKAGGELQRLARELLDRTMDSWPSGWPTAYRDVLGGEKGVEAPSRWTGIERTIGKEAWLSTKPPKPPWPLIPGRTPPIITFHSFKGGVARSTLVGAYAVHKAAAGKRVAVVDLDLEAPGAGHLLAAGATRGVVDILVDHMATGRLDRDSASGHSRLGHAADGRITVFAAGEVNDTYLQKLARLDYSSAEPGADNPVGTAVSALLKSVKNDFDIIVLDSRAGLHDLAGISLHGLAHVDVLVFRGTEQHFSGLGQTLRMLGLREPKPIVLVETFLPAGDQELFERRREKSAGRVYDLLLEHMYEDDPPQLADVGALHDVVPIRRKEWLDALDSLAGKVDLVLADDELANLVERIDAIVGLESAMEDGSEMEENE